jgi:hypothetical protein
LNTEEKKFTKSKIKEIKKQENELIQLNFNYLQDGSTDTEHTFRKNNLQNKKIESNKKVSAKEDKKKTKKKKDKSKKVFKDDKNFDLISKTMEIKASKGCSNKRKSKKSISSVTNTRGSVDKRRSSDITLKIKKLKKKSNFTKSKLNIKNLKKKKSNADSKEIVRSKSFLGSIKSTSKKGTTLNKLKNKKKKISKVSRGKSQSEKNIKNLQMNKMKNLNDATLIAKKELNDSCMGKIYIKAKHQSGKVMKVGSKNEDPLKLSLDFLDNDKNFKKQSLPGEETPIFKLISHKQIESKKKNDKGPTLKPPPVKLNKSSKKGNFQRKNKDHFRSPKERRRKNLKSSNSQSRYIIDIFRDKKVIGQEKLNKRSQSLNLKFLENLKKRLFPKRNRR